MDKTTTTRGAPKGNLNQSKNKPWTEALRKAALRAAHEKDGVTLDRIAKALLAKAADGDIQAIRELGDRLDGKAHQSVEIDANVSGKMNQEIVWQIVDPA